MNEPNLPAPLRVLVVEPYLDDYLVFEAAIGRSRKWKVGYAREWREAMMMAREEAPSLLFVERAALDRGGESFIANLRALPGLERVPVVMTSGSDNPEHVSAALYGGANQYVVKTGDLFRLQAILHEVCEYWTSSSRLRKAPQDAGPPLSSEKTAESKIIV